MPPITGFYAFVAGTVLFALLGSNPQMSVGADSTIAPLFAVGIVRLAPAGSRALRRPGRDPRGDGRGDRRADRAAAARLDRRVPVGADHHRLPRRRGGDHRRAPAARPVRHPLGQRLDAATGSDRRRRHLGDTNGWTLGDRRRRSSPSSSRAERIDRKLPGALVGLVGSTVVVARRRAARARRGDPRRDRARRAAPRPLRSVVVGDRQRRADRGRRRAGRRQPVGRDDPRVRRRRATTRSTSAATSSASAPATSRRACSVRSPSTPARRGPRRPPRPAGARRLAGLVAAAALIALIPAAGLLKDVPLATLAAVLIFVATRIFHVRDLLAIARFDRFEFGPRGGHAADGGAGRRRAGHRRRRRTRDPRPHPAERTAAAARARPHRRHDQLGAARRQRPPAAQVPGVLAVLFATPLWYANAVHFRAAGRGRADARGRTRRGSSCSTRSA